MRCTVELQASYEQIARALSMAAVIVLEDGENAEEGVTSVSLRGTDDTVIGSMTMQEDA